jgi:biopolymer transport protein ExbB
VASDATTELDHELESYDAASGALVVWVRMPSLRAGAEASVYLVYGDGKTDKTDASALWSDYHYVWHLAQIPSAGTPGAIKDATQRADGTAAGNMDATNLVAAVAGNGLAFDGMDDEITFRNDFTGVGPSTFSAWVNQFERNAASGGAVVSFGNELRDQARFLFSLDTQSGKTDVGFYSNDLTGTALATNTWSYLVWTWDGNNSSIYVNGALTTGPIAQRGANTSGSSGKIGNSVFSRPRFLRGQLDEIRVAPRVRSTGWVRTEYNNQRPGSNFIRSVDAEQARTVR